MADIYLPITAQITTTDKVFQQRLRRELRIKMGKTLGGVGEKIVQKVRGILYNELWNGPEGQSLRDRSGNSSSLLAHFGLENPEQKVQDIIQIILNGVQAEVPSPRTMVGNFVGRIKLVLRPQVMTDPINHPSAVQVTKKGETLNWFAWLSAAGSKIIIRDYKIKLGPSKTSRTGLAIMIKRGKWRVPPEFSGTVDNNWITRGFERTLKRADSKIKSIFLKALLGRLI